MKKVPNKIQKSHLFDRLHWAKENLDSVQSKYRVVFDNPIDLDAPACILVPDPNWLAAALNGSILPPIEAYLADQDTIERYILEGNDPQAFDWKKVGGAKHPYAKPIGPMTEEEAIEYLIMKDIPRHIWDDERTNRPRFKITTVDKIFSNRTYRPAWKLKEEAA